MGDFIAGIISNIFSYFNNLAIWLIESFLHTIIVVINTFITALGALINFLFGLLPDTYAAD